MTPKERFNRIMRFEPVDRPPVWRVEGVAEGTVRNWIKQNKVPEGMSLTDIIKIDKMETVTLDSDPLPTFIPETIDEDDEWITTRDIYGFTVRTLKKQSVSPRIYYYIGGTVDSRADWDTLKRRYDPADPRRKPRSWSPALWEYYNKCDCPVGMRIGWGPGRAAKNGYSMGLEQFLVTVADNPGFVKDIFDFWADFVIENARGWIENCHFDFVYFEEDGMGYKNSTLISPETYKALWAPGVRKVVDFLNANGIHLIGYYSSGDIRPLIPAMLDIGIDLHFPLEEAAGMNALELRQKYGKDLRLIGNISRQSLMDGASAVEKEFTEKVPPLMAAGGYIPAADDMIMPDISFESYTRLIDMTRNYRCT
jgi:uroporphyrinogen-III decarboxylase